MSEKSPSSTVARLHPPWLLLSSRCETGSLQPASFGADAETRSFDCGLSRPRSDKAGAGMTKAKEFACLTRVIQSIPRRLCLGPPRRSLLNLLLPAIFVIFFGGLSTAVKLSPRAYDWRRQSISWLLYPYNDPNFHVIASLAVAATGLLMVPCAATSARN